MVDIFNEMNSGKVMDRQGVGMISVGFSTNERAYSIARGADDCGLEICPHQKKGKVRPCAKCPGEF